MFKMIDGTNEFKRYTFTEGEDAFITPTLPHSRSATGYGKKQPTSWVVRRNNKMYRVYCCIYSNIGTCYIVEKGENIIVDID